MGGPASSLGAPSSTGLGSYLASSVKLRARGMVLVWTVQMNHAAPASELIQSMVAPSCSAAKTRSPPSFVPASVVLVELLLFLLLPHAAATSDSDMTATANARKFLLPRTRSRPPFVLEWT